MEAVVLILGLIALVALIVWLQRFSSRFLPRKQYDMERRNAERYWKYFDGSQLP
jgi:ABC-type transporter Mla subunit MlaD